MIKMDKVGMRLQHRQDPELSWLPFFSAEPCNQDWAAYGKPVASTYTTQKMHVHLNQYWDWYLLRKKGRLDLKRWTSFDWSSKVLYFASEKVLQKEMCHLALCPTEDWRQVLPITNPKASDPVVAIPSQGIDKLARSFSRSLSSNAQSLHTSLRLFGIIWIQRGHLRSTFVIFVHLLDGWLVWFWMAMCLCKPPDFRIASLFPSKRQHWLLYIRQGSAVSYLSNVPRSLPNNIQ